MNLLIPILMPCYNALALTRRAITSVLAQDVPTKLLVINNGSTDNSAQWLNSLDPTRVTSVHMMTNVGVSKAWNHGLRFLFGTCGVPYVLVVNNDIVLRPETARSLVEDGGGFVTGVGVDDEHEALTQPWTPSKRPHPDYSCALIRREVYERVGPFDERYWPAYFEDNDYHVRLHRAGVEAYSIGVPFYHYASGTLKDMPSKERAMFGDAVARNKEVFFQTYGCYPATHEYDALFDPSTFGVERRHDVASHPIDAR